MNLKAMGLTAVNDDLITFVGQSHRTYNITLKPF